MKKFLIAAAAILSLSTAAHASEVDSIDCLASNGVTIKGDVAGKDGLLVETHWGLFRRDFVASVSEETTAETVVINLDSKNGTEYQIALAASPYRLRTQKVTGSVLQPSTVRGAKPTLLAYVSCNVRVYP